MNYRNYKQNVNKFLSGYLEMPKDVIMDLPKLTLLGDIQLYIENHKGLIEYTGEKVCLNVSLGKLEILGQSLVIRTITSDEIYLDGSISSINLIR